MSLEVDVRGRGAGKTYNALTSAIKTAQDDAYHSYKARENTEDVSRHTARVLYVTTTGQEVDDFEILKIVSDYCKQKRSVVYIVEKAASVIRVIDRETEVIVHVEHFKQNLMSRVRGWKFNAMVQDGEFLPDLLETLNVGSTRGFFVADYVPHSLLDWMKDAADVRMSATVGVLPWHTRL